MPTDPSVSPADTPDVATSVGAAQGVGNETGGSLAPSPADTLRLRERFIDHAHEGNGTGCRCCALVDEGHLDALLAVGERDRAEIEALKAEVARLADRAVCSGCGQDVDEGGACHTPECHTGEMIPSSDLPGALLHLCEENAEEREEWRSDWEQLRAEAKALEVAGERDRQQIARLTEALRRALDDLGPPCEGLAADSAEMILAAVLAGEEDAANG